MRSAFFVLTLFELARIYIILFFRRTEHVLMVNNYVCVAILLLGIPDYNVKFVVIEYNICLYGSRLLTDFPYYFIIYKHMERRFLLSKYCIACVISKSK